MVQQSRALLGIQVGDNSGASWKDKSSSNIQVQNYTGSPQWYAGTDATYSIGGMPAVRIDTNEAFYTVTGGRVYYYNATVYSVAQFDNAGNYGTLYQDDGSYAVAHSVYSGNTYYGTLSDGSGDGSPNGTYYASSLNSTLNQPVIVGLERNTAANAMTFFPNLVLLQHRQKQLHQ